MTMILFHFLLILRKHNTKYAKQKTTNMAKVVVVFPDVLLFVMKVDRRSEVHQESDVHQTVDEIVDHRVRTVIVDIMVELGLGEKFPCTNVKYAISEDEIPLEVDTVPVGTEDHGKHDGSGLNNVARLCAIQYPQVDVVLEPILGCHIPIRYCYNRVHRKKGLINIDCSDSVKLLGLFVSSGLVTLASRNHKNLLCNKDLERLEYNL